VRRFSPGERIVFLPYGEEICAKMPAWLQERGMVNTQASAVDYATAVAT